jgi:hypothetical protein
MSALILTPTFPNLNNSDVASATVNFCLGATQATVGGGCLAANQGSFLMTWGVGTNTLSSLTGLAVGNVSNALQVVAIAIPAPYRVFSSISLTSAFTLSANGGNSLRLDDFAIGYDQIAVSPEPSTFVMLGSALAGLALYRKRRRGNP